MYIRKKEGRISSLKEAFSLLIKATALWGIAYVGMWIAKWGLTAVIFHVDVIPYVKDNAMLRINGLQGLNSYQEMYWGAIFNNWHNLYPINIIKKNSHLIIGVIVFVAVILVSFDWKNIKKKWIASIWLIIALAPYVRYLMLANHSYRHAFFTFRDQIITVICIVLIFAECLNYKMLFKEIKIGKK